MYAKLIDGQLFEAPYYVKKGNKDIFGYNSEDNASMLLADGYLPLEEVPQPADMRQPVKSYRQDEDKFVEIWTDVYVEPTIAEQNEEIRQARENAYKSISDYLKNDYDEAVARGAANAEQLKQMWLESKDKIRQENPYLTEK